MESVVGENRERQTSGHSTDFPYSNTMLVNIDKLTIKFSFKLQCLLTQRLGICIEILQATFDNQC